MTKTISKLDLQKTYFGYASTGSIQNIRKRDTLDKIFNYENRGIMSRKEFVFQVLQEGRTPSKRENYSYYSARIDDYTKPKTLYKLEGDNNYFEVTKTEYEYAQYLLENDFINSDKASQFIQNEKEEKERQEQERIKQEEQKKLKQEQQREAREKERLERQKEYREKHLKLGQEFIERLGFNPIKELLDKHVPEYIKLDEKENSRTVPKNEAKIFYNNWYDKLTILIGDFSYCNHTIKRYAEDHKNNNFRKHDFRNISLFLEQQLLLSVYKDIDFNDHVNTINAKMNAIYYDKEYKGSKPIQEYTFYYATGIGENVEFHESKGQKFNFEGITGYLRTFEDEEGKTCYNVTEESTGLSLSGTGSNKQDVISKARKGVRKNKNKVISFIQKQIERTGGTPLYKQLKKVD